MFIKMPKFWVIIRTVNNMRENMYDKARDKKIKLSNKLQEDCWEKVHNSNRNTIEKKCGKNRKRTTQSRF